jgi:BlaI family transcriptional regulator, penicillinase repressor
MLSSDGFMNAEPTSESLPRPTDAELTIIRVLWARGPSTVREVMEVLNGERAKDAAYTTVLKFMQIMHEKGLVKREESQRTHVYSASQPAAETQRQMVGDLMDRLFDGSAAALVQQALGAGKVSAAELSSIRKLLAALEKKPSAR